MKRIFITSITVVGIIFCSAAHGERLVIKGSDTLGAKLVPQLAEQFKTQHADATFDIAAEGSTTGIAALIDSTAQIGMASRPAKNEQIAAEGGKNPNGVGYVGLAYVKAQGIKVVSVDGETPSNDSVQQKKYPYARPTFFYTNGEPTGLAKQFVDFTLGPDGQKIVANVGFV